MKKLLSIILVLVITNAMAQGQNNKAIHNCDVPDIYTGGFDTTGCINHIDTISQMKSILVINHTGNNYYQEFNAGAGSLYYKHDTTSYKSLSYTINHIFVLIIFWDNGLIQTMRYTDSCQLTEIKYDQTGNIQEQFYCDYSKPNDCYKKEYINGKIVDETFYTPFTFYQMSADEKDRINSFSRMNQVIPLKMIKYDENGKPIKEIDLLELWKSLHKK